MRRAVKTRQRAALRRQQDLSRWGLTARMVRVVLAVYCLSSYSKECAIEFATRARKRRRSPVADLEEAECPIGQWYLDADVNSVADIFMPVTPEDAAIRTEAVKFLAERQTMEWVAVQNFQLGRAPTALSLVSNFSANLQAMGVEPAFRFDAPREGRGPKLGRTARRWCQKMRTEWGLRRRTLSEAEHMPREEVVHKAGS